MLIRRHMNSQQTLDRVGQAKPFRPLVAKFLNQTRDHSVSEAALTIGGIVPAEERQG